MKGSRKIVVLVPPLLIGLTILFVAFTHQHRTNEKNFTTNSDTVPGVESEGVMVIKPLPEPKVPNVSNEPSPIACTLDAKQCPDGSYVGRTGPNCEFAACVKSETKFCSKDSRLAEMCAEIYTPVCAAVKVECVTAPCNPVHETYSNECTACMNERVVSYQAGTCTSVE